MFFQIGFETLDRSNRTLQKIVLYSFITLRISPNEPSHFPRFDRFSLLSRHIYLANRSSSILVMFYCLLQIVDFSSGIRGIISGLLKIGSRQRQFLCTVNQTSRTSCIVVITRFQSLYESISLIEMSVKMNNYTYKISF